MTFKSDIHRVTLKITDLRPIHLDVSHLGITEPAKSHSGHTHPRNDPAPKGYVAEHKFTVARHPSETEARLMLRILAFALNASPRLGFHGELCSQDEPELCELEWDGSYLLWVEFGLVDERRIKRACQHALRAMVYAYGGRELDHWWQQLAGKCAHYPMLTVTAFSDAELNSLLPFLTRTMTLAVNIDEEGMIELSDGVHELSLSPRILQAPRSGH